VQEERVALSAATDCFISPAVVIGGFGRFGALDLRLGDTVSVRFTEDEMRIRLDESPDQAVTAVPFDAVYEIDVAGTKTRSGGGVIGGGFGLEGAAQGMAIASVLNALTTSTTISTVAHIDTDFGELFLHSSLIEAGALRLALSPAMWRIADRRRRARGSVEHF
jgi:hypothetical protein